MTADNVIGLVLAALLAGYLVAALIFPGARLIRWSSPALPRDSSTTRPTARSPRTPKATPSAPASSARPSPNRSTSTPGLRQPATATIPPSARAPTWARPTTSYSPAPPTTLPQGDVDETFDGVEQRVETYREENDLGDDVEVPVDAVTASGSGLGPHISVANARLQAARVAEERGLDLDEVLELVDDHTSERALGFLGEKGVNVLELNLALDGVTSGLHAVRDGLASRSTDLDIARGAS